MTHTVDNQTLIDVQEDYEFLKYLTASYVYKITEAKKHLTAIKKYIIPSSYDYTMHLLSISQQNLSTFQKNITVTHEYTDYLSHYDYIKSCISSISGIISSLDSQSPSFFSSWYSQAGRFTGTIKQSYNDYYRDQHTDGTLYEKQFKKEYIDSTVGFPIHVYATNSGMAALTTIVGFIHGQKMSNRPIFIGKSCYFEEKILLYTLFPDRVIEIDEQNISQLTTLVQENNPVAIFLDSISNSASLIQPDIHTLLRTLQRILKDVCYVVIDNTGLSITYQPFSHTVFPNKRMHLIVWESLLKHHQFGLDRVNGGIIYTNMLRGGEIYSYRDHLGTNISDIQVLSLPTPSRKFLRERLLRHERNNTILINIIEEKIKNNDTIINHIISPIVSTHPNNAWSKHLPFHGAYLSLSFQPNYDRLSSYQTFMKKVFNESKKRHVPLIGGTSFGFPITRLYIPASRPGQGTPFVRIAVGTEPYSYFLQVAQLIADVM